MIPVIAHNGVFLDQFIGEIIDLLLVDQHALLEFRLIITIGHNIVGNTAVSDHAVGHAVLGDVSNSALPQLTNRAIADIFLLFPDQNIAGKIPILSLIHI